MVPRPKLGGDSIYTLHRGSDSARDREFDSNVFLFLILIKACLILFAHTFNWFFCPFAIVDDDWTVGALFRSRLSEVHPTNSCSVPLPMMGFEYINKLPPIYYGPFMTKVGIMAHLVVSDLLIYPF